MWQTKLDTSQFLTARKITVSYRILSYAKRLTGDRVLPPGECFYIILSKCQSPIYFHCKLSILYRLAIGLLNLTFDYSWHIF